MFFQIYFGIKVNEYSLSKSNRYYKRMDMFLNGNDLIVFITLWFYCYPIIFGFRPAGHIEQRHSFQLLIEIVTMI